MLSGFDSFLQILCESHLVMEPGLPEYHGTATVLFDRMIPLVMQVDSISLAKRQNVDSGKTESQMGFEPSAHGDLVGCSNH